jgi:peptidoglycan-associated lipoprotein
MPRFPRTAPALLVMAVALTACPKKPAPATTPTPVNADSVARANAARDSIAAADRARADSLAREQRRLADSVAFANRAAADRAMAESRAALTAAVYFAYDQADLSPDAEAILDAKVPMLTGPSAQRLRITGHTDNRGSDEYNLALGLRRANSVKRYLTAHGVDESRLETVSMGEEQPIAQGDDEGARSQNRRAEFAVAGQAGTP